MFITKHIDYLANVSIDIKNANVIQNFYSDFLPCLNNNPTIFNHVRNNVRNLINNRYNKFESIDYNIVSFFS